MTEFNADLAAAKALHPSAVAAAPADATMIPARHIRCGDYINGHVVSQTRELSSARVLTLVVPFTIHSYKLTILAADLDAVIFPVGKRGDDYSPAARNAVLGLPEDAGRVAPSRAVPEHHATTPAGSRVADVPYYDRSQKLSFTCPEHNVTYVSKDPYCSTWFTSMGGADHGDCKVRLDDYIVAADYTPTRNG